MATAEEKRYEELMSAAPDTAAQSAQTQAAAAALMNAETAARTAGYNNTADGRLDAAISEYLSKSGYRYDLAADKDYQAFAREYSQNALRGREQSREYADTLANGYSPTYADMVANEVYSDTVGNYSNFAPSFAAAGRQQADLEASQAGNAAALYKTMSDTDYARERDTANDRMAYMQYLAGRYQTERQADLQRAQNESDIYTSRLSGALSNMNDSRSAANNRYLRGTQSADSVSKINEDNYEFNQKMAYTAAEDAYKDKVAADKAAATAEKNAAKEAANLEKAKDNYGKSAWKIQKYLSGDRKLTGTEEYDLDFNKDGKVDNSDLVTAGLAAKSGELKVVDAPGMDGNSASGKNNAGANNGSDPNAVKATDNTSRVISKIESSRAFTSGSTEAKNKEVIRMIEKEASKLNQSESLYVYRYFGLL